MNRRTAIRAMQFASLLLMSASTSFSGPARLALAREAAATVPGQTELDRYVAKPDDSFRWKLVSRRDNEQGTALLLDLTSQTWRTSEEVDRTQWKHWVWIVVPKGADSKTALMLIGGGSNSTEPPHEPPALAVQLATTTQSIVAEVSNIPNQPLELFHDGHDRREDDLLARTWRAAIEEHDLGWPAQLPMTKAAVRAMDAVQQATAVEDDVPAVERFVVAGASKRGWTTWLVGAVDDRVDAIAPVVIDVLNVRKSLRHHHDAYGFWAPAIGDYQREGLLDKLDDPGIKGLLDIVDPYVYRERLTMPKCIINASGDQFFPPDSSQFYFDQLPGEKLLSYVPNAGHGLEGSHAIETLAAFHASVVRGLARPRVSWTENAAGELHVTCQPAPERAKLWRAANPSARDFRFDQIGAAFIAQEIEADDAGRYRVEATPPSQGFTASFAEFEFDIGAGSTLRTTTPIQVSGSPQLGK
ncbi:MAG: PhoPQ-activated pathogenicity-related family protein [Planctomycetales bacterium]|nr:PhoPQ-activated pathogenicity-related family protein [Planctomycetales bacterium]